MFRSSFGLGPNTRTSVPRSMPVFRCQPPFFSDGRGVNFLALSAWLAFDASMRFLFSCMAYGEGPIGLEFAGDALPYQPDLG